MRLCDIGWVLKTDTKTFLPFLGVHPFSFHTVSTIRVSLASSSLSEIYSLRPGEVMPNISITPGKTFPDSIMEQFEYVFV